SKFKIISFSRVCSADVVAHLPQVSTNSLTSSLRVVPRDGVQQAFVMNLPALRAAFYRKNLLALFAKQVNNGVYKREDKCILGSFSQGAVKIVIGCNICICIIEVSIHYRHCLPHGSDMLLRCPYSSHSSNFRLEDFANLNQAA